MNRNQINRLSLIALALALALPFGLQAQSLPRSQAVLDQILATTPSSGQAGAPAQRGFVQEPRYQAEDTRPVPRAVRIEAELSDPVPLDVTTPNAQAATGVSQVEQGAVESEADTAEQQAPPSMDEAVFRGMPPMPASSMGQNNSVRQIGEVSAHKQRINAFTVPGESPKYESMSAWSNERVKVRLIRNASFAEALAALMPGGWTVDLSGVVSDLSDFRVDLTSTNARGTVISELLRELDLTGYPYVEFNTFVVASQ